MVAPPLYRKGKPRARLGKEFSLTKSRIQRRDERKKTMEMPIIAAVIGGIILFFVLPVLEKPRQKFLGLFGVKPKLEEPKPVLLNPEPAYLLTPDPFGIIHAIQATPLLQRDEAAKHYAGIPVDWKGELVYIEKIGAGMLKLQVRLSQKSGVPSALSVFLEINSSDYPGIGIVKAGDPVHIKGYIKKIKNDWFELRDSKLITYGKQPPR